MKEERRTHLARAVLAWVRADGSDAEEMSLDDYQAGKRELYERQHRKCAYCELQTGFGSQPTEHFRPKDGALRSSIDEPKRCDRDHYWWLTWTWENLLFSCPTCNGAKHNQFPLEKGSTPLPPPPREIAAALPLDCFRLDMERPLLIDPSVEDPLDHIEWRPVNPGAPVDKLRWRPFHKTTRGRRTVDILGWERLGLPDHVNTHITCVVYPRIKRLLETIAEGNEAQIQSLWGDLVSDLLHPEMPHLAATHDALNHFMPAGERRRLGLQLPRPGSAGAAPPSAVLADPPGFDPSAVLADPPGFDELPALLQWELRALGERSDPAKRDRALVEICRFRPSTAAALSELIGRGLDHAERCLDALVKAGSLARDPDGRGVVYRCARDGGSRAT